VPTTCPDSAAELDQERTAQLAECRADGEKPATCMEERGWTRAKKPQVDAFVARCESDRAVAMAAADGWVRATTLR
jgi:hypothetical protein